MCRAFKGTGIYYQKVRLENENSYFPVTEPAGEYEYNLFISFRNDTNSEYQKSNEAQSFFGRYFNFRKKSRMVEDFGKITDYYGKTECGA